MNSDRRRFLRTAVFATAAVGLPRIGSTSPSLGSLKQADAGALNVGYAEVGPSSGPPVILLHGWPYDIHTYVDVAPLLGSAGYRVLVPYLRGYGTTRFLSSDTPRNGQQSVIAVDVIALMDALRIEKAIVAGCDWGARTANIVAALWPERCKSPRLGKRLPDRQPRREQDAPATESGARMVVSVLLRHGTRPRRLRGVSAGFCEAHLAARVAALELR